MAKFCKDHILDSFSPRFDLDCWLEDLFKSHNIDRMCSPKIIIGDEAFKIFQLITQEIVTIYGARVYRFKGYDIPQYWITIDQFGDPYYITIRWEEPEFIKFFSSIPWDPARLPDIKKVIYNNPATIIFWSDHTKTVVQCQKGDDYDPEKGLAMAIAKKALGNTSRKLNDVLHKWEAKE